MGIAVSVNGFVEALVHSQIISGWTYLKDEEKNIFPAKKVYVHNAQGHKLGEGIPNIRRPDLDGVSDGNYFGFHIKLTNKLQIPDLATCKIGVSIDCSSPIEPLKLTKKLNLRVQKANFNAELVSLKNRFKSGLDEHETKMIDDLLNHQRVDKEIKKSFEEASIVSIPEGSVSPLNIATSGKEGHFFLYGGSNNLDNLYKRKQSETYKLWLQLIATRQQKAQELNTKFVQLIIPEKQSVIPEHYPFEMQAPTENLELLENAILHSEIEAVLSLSNVYQTGKRSNVFRRTDTHFSTLGARHTVEAILNYFDLPLNLEPEILTKKLSSGDLGNKFAGPDFLEEITYLKTDHPPTLLEQANPKGKHLGIIRKWRNEHAPLKMKAVAFGNSFFERGDTSTGLSWWFARLFEEFHFYWSAECQWDIVEQESPDIVVCQTIERFLTRIPAD